MRPAVKTRSGKRKVSLCWRREAEEVGVRRSRNFLRYTNIRQRQKSERRSSDTQAKCPILPDNVRLHFFQRQERTLQSVISDRSGRRPWAGLLGWNRCSCETGQATRSLDEIFSFFLFSPRGGQKSTRSCAARRGSMSTAPLTNTQPALTSLPRPLTKPPSSVCQSRDRTEKLVSELHRKSTHKHKPPLAAN